MSTNFFSSLNGSFDYVSSMSGLLSDYSSIKNGSYGSLMKSYVNKVGNKNALNAYRETGSTATAESVADTSSTKKTSSSKTSFLDSHLNSISKSGYVPSSEKEKTAEDTKKTDSTETATAATTTTTTDKYAKYKSSWLDDQLKQYDKDANKTTAADTSVAMDTTI
ncbi:hypothetical protein [Butyrivibrio proteoclasticus]|uniref:hypothetical protein n=1 Tax=Butyrivibrio proteoclasticus TaxID=43305 RepID=UPI000479C77B|nr:hypothetical protein [Butyrivibrio proteoclasticus]